MNFGTKTIFDSKKYTGFFTSDVVAINPTREELSLLKGYEIKPPEEGKDAPKPFEYEGKDPSGEEFIDIVFYLKAMNHDDKPIMSVRFRLIDKDVISEKEVDGKKVSSYQWVNAAGSSTWCDSEKNLLDKFTHVQIKGENVGDRAYRKAIQGEGNLYNFLQAWLDKGVAFFGEASKDTDIFIDKKKAFRNIDKYVDSELRPLLKSEQAGKFNALATVGISEKDGKVNHFQNVYNNFWPEWKFKSMVTSINTGDWNINADTLKSHDYLVKSLKKSAYSLGWIKLFSESEHLNAGSETFKEADETTGIDVADTSY